MTENIFEEWTREELADFLYMWWKITEEERGQ